MLLAPSHFSKVSNWNDVGKWFDRNQHDIAQRSTTQTPLCVCARVCVCECSQFIKLPRGTCGCLCAMHTLIAIFLHYIRIMCNAIPRRAMKRTSVHLFPSDHPLNLENALLRRRRRGRVPLCSTFLFIHLHLRFILQKGRAQKKSVVSLPSWIPDLLSAQVF